jgi:hypothetical protein
MKGYKLCKCCGQPMLKKGQKRRHPDAYRHAQGCRYATGKYYKALKELEESIGRKYCRNMTLEKKERNERRSSPIPDGAVDISRWKV